MHPNTYFSLEGASLVWRKLYPARYVHIDIKDRQVCFKKHANSTNHPLCFVGALFVKSCRCLPTSSQLSTTSCLAFSCLVHVFAVLAIVYFIMQSLWIMHAFVHVSVGGNLCVCIVGEVAEAILLCAWAVLLAYPSSFIPISLWLSKLDPPPLCSKKLRHEYEHAL